jgi:negative regulator of sigma E activity
LPSSPTPLAPARKAPWPALIAGAALAAAAALALVAAGVAAWSAQPDAPQSYSKLTWQAHHLRADAADRGYTPITAPDDGEPPAQATPARPDRRKRVAPQEPADASKKRRFQFDGGEDVFDPRRP